MMENLEQADRAHLLNEVSRHRYGKDEFILSQDDDTSDVFFVLSGGARATIYGADGSVVSFRDLGPGAIFGEFAAVDGKPRSASVIAVEDSEVGLLRAERFRQIILEHPGLNWAFVQHLTGQARVMTQRIFEFSTMLVRERLMRELLRMSEGGADQSEGITIHAAPSQTELASRISTHREAVSREMSRLSKQGILSRQRDTLIIHDRGQLEQLLQTPDEL